jgi:hypothetical protein
MKNIWFLVIIVFFFIACEKEKQSASFLLLTENIWDSDSLLANGIDAGGPGGILEKFNGEAMFNKNGTGVFGDYTGTWRLANDDSQIIISSDSLAIRTLTTNIVELNDESLKITTSVPNPANLSMPLSIRMTFNAR